MTDQRRPVTLSELLATLEKSQDLRSLARDCGLTVRELRKRLTRWRQEIAARPGEPDEVAPPTGAPVPPPRTAADRWPDLPRAADLRQSPLPGKGSRVLEIWTDGASKGNPGPAAIGIVFCQKDGPQLCSHSEAVGRATNNVAEYRAVVRALEFCRRWGIDRLVLHLDSELIARQLTGVYRVKSPDLRPLYQQVVFLSGDLKSFRVRHVRREQNGLADHLANQALRGRPTA